MQYKPAPSCKIVIFGAAGDLTKRLVTPALYNLAVANMLPDDFAVIGVDLAEYDDANWRKSLGDMIVAFVGKGGTAQVNEQIWSWLSTRMSYLQGDFSDPATFRAVADRVGGANVLFYLAVADRFFGDLVERLGEAQLVNHSDGEPWRRVIIEKPFGHDLASAKALNAQILRVLEEDQIYRMDHFLGKETVQNIMMLRFGNGVFESLWNREHIDHVQITVAETVGVERRGKFYERTGALRDMVPNHVFQLLSVVAMEPPISFDADAVRAEKAKVLQAIHLDPTQVATDCVRGQYEASLIDGATVAGYRDEPDVSADSKTETYVALKLLVDNWRWAGTPFYLRTGKHLTTRRTEIMVEFRRPPFTLFRDTPVDSLAPNRMVLHIQPDEGISLLFNAKIPGPAVSADGVRMDFRYKDFFDHPPSTGYETLLYDCMIGEATLFQRADFVEAGWRIVQPILEAWQSSTHSEQTTDLELYPAGGQGPAGGDALLERDGRAWRKLA
jgi:glucose-6-phosphate 1-dehydrogenase